MVLSGTAGNSDPDATADISLIRVLGLMEIWLEKAGTIGSDFAAMV